MRCKQYVLVFILTFIVILSGFGEELKQRIAIIPFTAINIKESNAQTITGLFETALVKTNIYTIIEQKQIATVIESQKLSLSGFTNSQYEIELGKLLTAEQIILGELSIIANEYVLNVKIVDITTGMNINAENIKTDSLSLLIQKIDQIAYKLVGLTYTSIESSKISPNKTPNKFNFTLGTGLSYLNGQFREIVYPSAGWESPYLSELLWNLDNIFLLNLTAGAQWKSWILNISASTSITTETGEMTDTDWLDSANTDKTHWSLSRIWLDNSFILNTNILYATKLSHNFSLQTGLGYKLNFWDWEDKVLDFIYPDPQPPNFIGENGIDYKVIQNIFYTSAEIIYSTGKITTGLNISLSPFIYSWDLDHHVLTQTYYMDSFYANLWYRAEFTLGIKAGQKGGILFTAYREGLPETTGDTYQYAESASDPEEVGVQTGYYKDGSGLASSMWGISLSYIWTF